MTSPYAASLSRTVHWLGCAGITGLLACAGWAQGQAQGRLDHWAGEMQPILEGALGLPFRTPPVIAVREAEQVRSYLVAKLDADYPPEKLERIQAAYQLFGLIPDTLHLRSLLVALYTEQVVGYYDPDSATLYVVAGSPRDAVRHTLAHELVHALQGQHMPLDSLLGLERNNDRRLAAQAVVEGQATLVSLRVAAGGAALDGAPHLWAQRQAVQQQKQDQMPVYSRAPLVIREGLIFPYLAGTDFMYWFGTRYPDTVPFGPRLPESTEQILHPDRYAEGDRPVDLAFGDGDGLLYDDNLGEFETGILLTVLSGSDSVGSARAVGWAGDRYGLFAAGDGAYALVWWSVWDSDAAGAGVATLLEQHWLKRRAPGRRATVVRARLDGRPAVRLVDAPVRWERWRRVPEVVTR